MRTIFTIVYKIQSDDAHKFSLFVIGMGLFISSLNTGSNGNCFYIGNDNEAILIDAGLTCKETEIRMQRLSLSMSKVKGIFISHEHSDHIRGLPVLAKKYQIPIYITKSTLLSGKQFLQESLINSFTAYVPILLGNLSINAFPKNHDGADPHSFTISSNGITIGVFTDIGSNCDHVIANFKKCNAIFLEANYDDEMLDKGSYPYFLKNRIRGGNGHLSNQQSLDLFLTHKPTHMSHVFLSHLSKDNNCPDLVYKLFSEHANGTEIIVASRLQETDIYHINA